MQTPQDPLYTKTPLPPVTPEAIRILFNNTNALQRSDTGEKYQELHKRQTNHPGTD
jgi:hypothetical protein